MIEPDQCPICGGSDVMPATDAKSEYEAAAEGINEKAILGFKLADHYCNNPDCGGLWGGRFSEPMTMEEVIAL
jgi:hypothetical protein